MIKKFNVDDSTGEITGETVTGGLAAEMVESMYNELERAGERYWRYNHSIHESYSLIREELEESQEAIKVIPDSLKEAWKQVRENDPTTFAVFCEQIRKDALHAAGECIQLAAMALKASESVYKEKDI